MPKPKLPEKLPEAPAPVLVPQPHGGALLSGGIHGHEGTGGRPASEIRKRLRGSFAARIAILEEIADGGSDDVKYTAPDRMKAIDILAKYGLGTTKELTVEHVRDRLHQTLRAIHEVLPKEEAEKLIAHIEPIWR